MKKWFALVLALAMMTLLMAGCTETDPEKIAATVLGEINGEKILKGEALKVYDFMLTQIVASNAQSGITLDPAANSTIANVKAQTLNMMAEGVVLDQKLTELGNGFTDEDRAQFAVTAQTEYVAIRDDYMNSYGVTQEEADTTLQGMGYTEDALAYMVFRNELDSRLLPLIVGDYEPSDAEVQTRFDALAAAANETYAQSPSQYVSDVLNGTTVYTVPLGFRSVKNLVIGFSDEVNEELNAKDEEWYNKYIEQLTASSELSAEDLTDEQRIEIEGRVAVLEEEVNQISADFDALIVKGQEEIRPIAEEVLAKAQEPGADFDALMAEYSIDNGSPEMVAKGYPVAEGVTNYVESFTTGAMALANVGDISGIIESDYGVHILKYEGDLAAGPVALETVYDTVKDLVMTDKETEMYQTQVTDWINKAKIKTYIERF